MSDEERELLQLNERLLDSIANADWKTYSSLCDPSLSAFEPEGAGQLVHGMRFHKFYFDTEFEEAKKQSTMCAPYVRLLGDVAIVCCVRLVQIQCDDHPRTFAFEETRVWQRGGDGWKHVHFHRSRISPGMERA